VTRTRALAVLAVVAALAVPACAQAGTNALDLSAGGVQELDGAAAGDLTGVWVAAGDVNGDGRPDAIAGAPFADPVGRLNAGAVQVALGTSLPSVDLAAPGTGDFRVEGAAPGELAGYSVAAAGDVNGDGVGDVVLGAPGASPLGRAGAGSAYVVFGSRTPRTVDLAALGPNGFRIDGEHAGDELGYAVAGAGDVNGDHLADVVVGAPFGGAAYVVFGRPSAAPVDLAALGGGGYRIGAAAAGDQTGGAVAPAGDVNRDGRADVLVGSPSSNARGRQSGSAFVVFGKSDSGPIGLGTLGPGGYRIDGTGSYDLAGFAVASAGDVNGDGVPDALVGAPGAGQGIEGAAYVVYGQPGGSSAAIELGQLGAGGQLPTGGFALTGVLPGDGTGASLAAPGDLDGDGRGDLVIGAWPADPDGFLHAGSAFVVRGATGPEPIDLGQLGDSGFRVDGGDDADYAGVSVAGAGSFDGDALGDALVGASGRNPRGRRDAGAVYVIAGRAGLPAGAFGDLSISPSRFRPSARSMPRRARAAASGAVVSYRTAGPATVTLDVFRRVNGRRVTDDRGPVLQPATTRLEPRAPSIHCAGPARTRHSRRCVRHVLIFTATRIHARAGVHRVTFTARVGGYRLRPGAYVLVATAKIRGREFGPQIARFRILR
jgi:hypothetical protein